MNSPNLQHHLPKLTLDAFVWFRPGEDGTLSISGERTAMPCGYGRHEARCLSSRPVLSNLQLGSGMEYKDLSIEYQMRGGGEARADGDTQPRRPDRARSSRDQDVDVIEARPITL